MSGRSTKGFKPAQTVLNRISPTTSLRQILEKTTESICRFTTSRAAFIADVDNDQSTYSLLSWFLLDKSPLPGHLDQDRKWSLKGAGKWADQIRKHKYSIENHATTANHEGAMQFVLAGVQRFLVTPIIKDNKLVALIGVGGRDQDYTQPEAENLKLYAETTWDLISYCKQIDLYQNLVDITNDWETLVDEENTFRYCSSNCEKITGYSCEEFNHDPDLYIKMVHPDDRNSVIDHFNEMHSLKGPSSMVFRIQTKEGEQRWIELYCRPFHGSDGKYLGRRGSNRDITDRKVMELQNQGIKESLEMSQRIAHLGNYEVDLKSGNISLSRECQRILGLEENSPLPFFSDKNKIVHPDDFDFVTSQMALTITQGKEFDLTFRIFQPDGEIRFVQNIGKPKKNDNGEVVCIFGTIQDITEKKNTENKLLDSEVRFRGILENASSMAVQGYSPDGTVQYWNPASTQIYGYSEEEALGKNLVDLIIPPEMRDEVRGAIKLMAETGQPIPSAELSLMHKNGSRVDVFSSHTIVRRLNHEPELFCIDLDLSEHKKIESALRESETKFRSLVENISDTLFLIREDGTIRYISPSRQGSVVIDSNEVIGHSFLEYLHPDETPEIISRFDRLINTGEKIEGLEFRLETVKGSWEWHSTTATLQSHTSKGEREIIGIIRNINESKFAERIRDAEVEIMNICHFAKDKRSLLRDLVEYFKDLTSIDAVAVRLHEGNEFPYYTVQGFSDEFIKSENLICMRDSKNKMILDENGMPVLDCLCGHILSRHFDIDENHFTKFGSFFSNNTTNLENEIKNSKKWGHIRNNCNRFGYESVALIPLRARGKVFGLFQFNDRRRDFFNNGLIPQLENLVDYASLALANFESTEALRESEEKYRILVENASEAICVLQDGKCQFCNPKMVETSGYSNSSKAGKRFMDLIHPDDRAKVENFQLDHLKGNPSESSILCRLVRESGEIRWIELSSAAITWAGKPATFNFMSDITERKKVQDALSNSEVQLRDMIDNFDGAIWAVDKNFKLIIFNSTYQMHHRQVFGHEVALGDDLYSLTNADEKTNEEWHEIHSNVLKGERVTTERKISLVAGVEYLEISYFPIRDSNNKVVGVAVIVVNITERKRGEDERRALEERFYNAFHTSPDSISINSVREGLFIDVNNGFTQMTGYTAEEVIGKSALDVNLWANPADREKMIHLLMNTGEMINLETPILTKDGRTKISLMSAKLIQINGEDCNLMIVRDISERKLAEAKLNEQIDELRRWHAVTLGRETRIIDLKNEVNELLIKAGKPPKYAVEGDAPHV